MLLKTIIKFIFADARKNSTLVLEQNPVIKRFDQWIFKEEHISVTSEPNGHYITHFTAVKVIPPNEPTKQADIGLFNWVDSRVHESLEVIRGDSTSSVTVSGKLFLK